MGGMRPDATSAGMFATAHLWKEVFRLGPDVFLGKTIQRTQTSSI